MAMSRKTLITIKSYQNQAQFLLKNYLFADSCIPYTSILGGILLCKVIYDLTQLVSTFYVKSYNGLTKIQRIEWNNRGMSTIHAIFITAMSVYFVFWSDLFSDQQLTGAVTFRRSPLSIFSLGVSVGYFLADLGMIFWLYPSLGGMEYVIHHSLSGVAVAYSMFSGEGQLYTFMILISEITTPEINMRWFLDTAGMKRSILYLINGVLILFAWLAARIVLFGYMFYHVYLHYDQVIQLHPFGYFLVFVVPSGLAIMNLIWFGKILRGLKKTLAKKQGVQRAISPGHDA
ncbi:Transmembrane protein 56-B [Morella rubra]|uniref:Transmembrane protein 56-B n=1 Tax=Morella rubra TaxID=262757 RepID=A0A6A1WD02_9ROSI|nr:Transmembrane protein 56-B [Morella rubra]